MSKDLKRQTSILFQDMEINSIARRLTAYTAVAIHRQAVTRITDEQNEEASKIATCVMEELIEIDAAARALPLSIGATIELNEIAKRNAHGFVESHLSKEALMQNLSIGWILDPANKVPLQIVHEIYNLFQRTLANRRMLQDGWVKEYTDLVVLEDGRLRGSCSFRHFIHGSLTAWSLY